MPKYFSAIVATILLVFLFSCQQNIDDVITPNNPPPPPPPPPPGQFDSISLLHGTGGVGFFYKTNDTLVSKLYYFNPNLSSYFDTTWIYYTANNKIERLLTLANASGYVKYCLFPVYTGDKITKVYTKSAYESQPEFYDNNFLSNMGVISPGNIDAYDSIVYDSRGRITGNYHRVADGSQFKIKSYDILSYMNPNTGADSLLYSAKYYEDPAFTGTFTERNRVFFYEYDLSHGKVNPMYKAFKEYALFQWHPMIWLHFIHPVDAGNSDKLDRYIAMNPYVVKRIELKYEGASTTWVTYTLRHEYESDGKLHQSFCDNIFASGVTGYSYVKIRKP